MNSLIFIDDIAQISMYECYMGDYDQMPVSPKNKEQRINLYNSSIIFEKNPYLDKFYSGGTNAKWTIKKNRHAVITQEHIDKYELMSKVRYYAEKFDMKVYAQMHDSDTMLKIDYKNILLDAEDLNKTYSRVYRFKKK